MEVKMKTPHIWIALLRIVVGAWFVKAVWTKLTLAYAWGILPYPAVSQRFIGFHPKRVAEFAAGNPVEPYKQFIEGTVLPNAQLFARLQAYGEAVVGFGLVTGLCVGITALIGLLLCINYGLATQWMSFGQQGFHILLITSMVIFLGARAGRTWGLDGLILRVAAPVRRPWLKIIMSLAILAVVPAPLETRAAELRVFITNEKSNNVTAIEALSGKVLGTIAVGQRPRGITASADGSRVFVANSNSNNISVIDSASLKVIDSFPAGVDPEGITIDRRNRLYVANENESALTIIDVSKREIIKRHQVGLEPETAVLSPDERWVTVSNESSNDIYFINTETAAMAGKVDVPRNPRGMRFSADSRRLYVASEQEPMVSIIDVAGRKLIQSMPTGGERPVDIVICPDGQRIYVSHGRSEDVRVFDAPTWKLLASIPVGPRAWWMAQTPDGRFLYVTVGRGNEVVMIDTRSNTIAHRIPAGQLPWGIAIAEVN
jgi:PQQ-dependent catabolism-associated beta-propeller protein